jgi:serine/threonine protein kinase
MTAPERAERFVFQERLGAGASGSVHRAYDKQRATTVAVKVLAHVDPGSVYRFKGEFRALTGIAHPNLLQLYDLVLHDGEWLLTMELVEGSDFLRHVRPLRSPSSPPSADAALHTELDQTLGPEASRTFDAAALRRSTANDNMMRPSSRPAVLSAQLGALDEGRLRSALRQLAEGLCALHASGHLHRDLKPANVLVFASDARLVIGDFGLVTEVSRVRSEQREGGIAGTLAYMSPEQATGHALSEASDWYAVGVMLYQALTGSLPFSTRLGVQELVAAKQRGVVVHPCSVAGEAPEDLAELAVALLDADPGKRPRYADVVARLDGTRKRPSLGPTAPQQLVGRAVQREQLAGAFARARAGRATVAMVGGRSGMGKSSLVQHFLEQARAQRALVLAGRCYEREELPHKSFDPLMDALSAYLLTQPEGELRELLPANVAALARLFPSLRRVPAIAETLGKGEVVDPLELKRRAYGAFRQLCVQLTLRQPLVLFIDDLQWGDLDSVQLFGELLHAPEAPSLLFIGAYRLEDEEQSPLLRTLRASTLPELGITPVEVRVDALADADARELVLGLLRGVEDAEQAARLVAAEAGGSPFFARELALHVRARGTHGSGERRLETLIVERLHDLPRESRALFELIAAAGRPEKRALLQGASGLGEQAFPALRVLEARNLVHSTGTGTDDRIEAYHDRLRETAYKQLDAPTRQRLHRALAEALEQSAERDPEALFEHWRQSDHPVSAGGYALEAARKAESQLAFERAARLYQHALERLAIDDSQRRGLIERLGHCLALAGRGIEAADAFRLASADASPAQAMQLRGLATTQLLRAGKVAAAYRELDSAQELTGLRVPASNLSAVFMLLWRRLKIRFRRVRWRKGSKPPDPQLLQRADMLWGIGAALVVMDNLRGAVYQAEHLLVALRSNDPYRLARAMGVEVGMSAATNRNPARTQYFIDRGLEVGGLSGEPHALSAVKGTAGVARFLEGRFREAQRLTRESQQVLRERLNATLAWDLNTMVTFDLQATAYLGNVSEIVARVPGTLRDAEARGDLYAATSCRTRRCIWAWLGPDQVEEAYRQVKLAEDQWNQEGYHLQHWYATQALAEVDLYADQPERSLARLEGEWRRLLFLRKIQYTRIEVWHTRARLSLALARKGDRKKLLRSARADARSIVGEGAPWGFAIGRLMQACAASFDDVEQALCLLRELEGQFDALDMRLHQEVARYRHGQLHGGEEGRLLVERAEQAIRALGVVRPAAFVALLAPGFPDVASNAHDA